MSRYKSRPLQQAKLLINYIFNSYTEFIGMPKLPLGANSLLQPIVRQASIFIAFLVTALLGAATGVIFAYAEDLPQITALDDYQPRTITRLLATDGQELDQFATEKRVVITYDDIGSKLRAAILATEDAGFNQHFGLSASRILITAVRDLLTGELAGASTLTQQLARNLFPIGREKTVERKIKEALLAIQIERRYTKREIFTFYANQIYFGHGAYGVEAAARLYFGKAATNLTFEEAATLAGIIQAPGRISPFVNSKRSLQRRNFVLGRMETEGYLSEHERSLAVSQPIITRGHPTSKQSPAPYFAEHIRQKLQQTYGTTALYEGGLTVKTTLDPELQALANKAVDRALRRLDKRRSPYRSPTLNVLTTETASLEEFLSPRWHLPFAQDDIVPALVTELTGRSARIRIGKVFLNLPQKAFAWTRQTSAQQLFKVGDVIEVQITELADGLPTQAVLEQPPLVEGALLAVDNKTGEIRSMVGGFNFDRSEFNRATQAFRQMGSTFKPIVYTAAIDRGFTATSTFIDEPVTFEISEDQPLYEPENYDNEYKGVVTLRRALEQSRNIPTVKLVHELGPPVVVEYAKRFGFQRNIEPYLSLALGAPESSLVEITSAYSAFANGGVRMTPYSIISVSDREGNILEENAASPNQATRADTAFVMTHLLQGVIKRGTGTSASGLEWPLGGKTGTTDEYTDAWFVGFDPNITVGVWVGHDEKKPLGKGETGASAALPIWIDFMQGYIDLRGDRENPPEFNAPSNIVFSPLDSGIIEAFINGTQPTPSFSALE